MNVFELTRRLIEIESMTGDEKNAALFLADYLSGLGYSVTLQEVAPGRLNVLAFVGKPDLIFTTHIDTVPPYIPYREDDDFIHGRGACDAKGIIAAQVEAANRLRTEGETGIGLLFVVGEERDSAGAIYAASMPPGSRFFINGEPTENRLVSGCKGSLRIEIMARGKAAHSAYPEMGESAILKLLDILADIRSMPLPSDPVLGVSTCNIGILSGGVKANVIPDSARAEIMFRSVEEISLLKNRLESLVAGRAEMNPMFEVPVTMMNTADGFDAGPVSFASDVPFLTSLGAAYMMGPGSILDAHTDHERISKRQQLEGVELYIRLAKRLLNSSPEAR